MSTSKSDSTTIGKAAIGMPVDKDPSHIALLQKAAQTLEAEIQQLLAKNAALIKQIAEQSTLLQGKAGPTGADSQKIQSQITAELNTYQTKLADLNQLMAKVALLTGTTQIDSSVLSRLKEELNQAIKKLLEKNKALLLEKGPTLTPPESSHKKPRRR